MCLNKQHPRALYMVRVNVLRQGGVGSGRRVSEGTQTHCWGPDTKVEQTIRTYDLLNIAA